MPTIDQLPPATAASDTDEILVSQAGITRKVTRAQILVGVQPQISVASGTLLGNPTSATCGPAQISVGTNLSLSNGTLSASSSPYIISQLPGGTVPAGGDLVPLGQAGSNTTVTYSQFASGLSGIANINASQMLIVPTGTTSSQKLSDFAASSLTRAGGTLTGTLTLASDPGGPLQAGTKQYIDTRVLRAGDAMTGPLTLASDPTASVQAATKNYVDNQVALSLPRSGGSITGSLTLAANPSTSLQAATKQYVDGQVASALPLAGGVLAGPVTLPGNPTTGLQAATKQYVDGLVSANLPLAGGTLTGGLTLAANPTGPMQAATKQYIDGQVASALPLGGGTLTGGLTLAANPTAPMQAATKQYIDGQVAGALPLGGGTLLGGLTLPANPAAAMQASTKQYVDAQVATALPLAGGTLNGALTVPLLTATGDIAVKGNLTSSTYNVSQVGGQTTVSPTQINLQRAGSSPTDPPLVAATLTVNHTGGGSASYSNTILTTTVNDAVSTTGQFIDGTLSDVYSFISSLNVNSVVGSNASPTSSQHVAITAVATKNVPAGGYPSGRVGAQMWGLWIPVTDATNLPSSTSGAVSGVEMDLLANNLDTVNRRLGYQYALAEQKPLAAGGYPAEWGYGIYFTTSISGYYKFQISAGGNYSIAVLDTRNAFPGRSKITLALTSPGKTISVDPVLPFSSAGVYGLPVSTTNWAQIKVGSNTYTQVGYTLDGAGKTSGTITFTTNVSVADGALGSAVIGASRTIWMATGQQVCFDYNGNINLFFDTTVSATHLTSALLVDGQLIAKGGAAVSGGPLNLPTYTVAQLPAASVGALAYATNGRKPNDASGFGTGVLVCGNGANQWVSTISGAPVAA
jgi:hypothetical protein